jgi:hypothetical protein
VRPVELQPQFEKSCVSSKLRLANKHEIRNNRDCFGDHHLCIASTQQVFQKMAHHYKFNHFLIWQFRNVAYYRIMAGSY